MSRYYPTAQPVSSTLMITGLISLVLIVSAIGLYFKFESNEKPDAQTNQPLAIPQTPQQASNQAMIDDSDIRASGREISPNTSENDSVPQSELPELMESDSWFINKISELSPGLAAFFPSGNLIKSTLVIVNDFSQGQRIAKHMRPFKLSGRFKVGKDNQGLFLPQSAYQRYAPLATAIGALDAQQTVDFYVQVKPLLSKVYQTFGYPAAYQLEDIFNKAAAEIIAAPIVEGRIALVKPSVYYKYADPQLEQLNGVQKQMLRMGPENTRIIQSKLRKILQRLNGLSLD